ncbi:NAD(P)H-binding protein [Methylobacterium nonmethylotrophicum]|uniref:NAD-dependent epimerase/dehydratase family protein n=1 Tax=Methylobacterium nonmethylotrophicum TaxID=1141884 RepID=A0A4Z0NKH5_9HYPH|nr:NAD(P)H-binding protein [Methylobacterium nonmethylotrophicum]TGD96385.1 NAD-dependent epimerase/dehydratase family protein [Methylobacterium nonmethylotrophicum]
MTTRTALVLGATGGVGGAVARRLMAEGWTVRAMHRDPERVRRAEDGLAWVRGDAMVAADVAAAAAGASLLVHAVNPPGYRDWDRLVLPMLDASIEAARAADARLLLPGNVYVYGRDAGPNPGADAPQTPRTAKGRIRIAMEARLRESGLRSLVVRAGDFFGPRTTGNSWFSAGLVRPGRPVRTVLAPGAPGIGHQWAYLPDVAETMVRLAAREAELPRFAAFNMDGHWDPDGRQMIAAIARAVGREVRVRRFPWGLLPLAAPFWPLAREIREMRYLWQEPLRMSNAELVGFLGAEPRTPLDRAVRETLAGLGCLPPGPGSVEEARGLSPRPAAMVTDRS